MTGTTVVTRESEWNSYTRSRAFALLAYRAQKCPKCGNYDTLERTTDEPVRVRWDEYGRRVEVVQFRCLTCASADAVKRLWADDHAQDEPETGQASPADGLMFMATPTIYEEG